MGQGCLKRPAKVNGTGVAGGHGMPGEFTGTPVEGELYCDVYYRGMAVVYGRGVGGKHLYVVDLYGFLPIFTAAA